MNAVAEQEVKVENVREGVRQLSEEALTRIQQHFEKNPAAALFFLFSAGGPCCSGQEEWAGLVLRT